MRTFLTTLIVRLTPAWLYRRLVEPFNRDGLKKYAHNTSWLFLGKIISYPLSLFSIAVVARYLGPAELGLISYVQSLVAIFVGVAALGIDEIVNRDLVRYPDRENEILGTAFMAKFVAGIIAFVTITTGTSLWYDDATTEWLIIITALTLILNPFTIISSVFSARALSKYTVITAMIIGIVIPLTKIVLAVYGASIFWFAGIFALETILGAVLLWYFYSRIISGRISDWAFNPSLLREFLSASWPLIIAGGMGYIFVRSDQLMLQYLSTPVEVGYYAAVSKITEAWIFIPGVLIGALYPAIVAHKDSNRSLYYRRLRDITLLTLLISGFISFIIFLTASFVVDILYGDMYLPAVAIMTTHVWLGVLVSLWGIMRLYLVSENQTTLIFIMTVVGVVSNIILNFILIPDYGGVGAAYATIIANVLMMALILTTKPARRYLYRHCVSW